LTLLGVAVGVTLLGVAVGVMLFDVAVRLMLLGVAVQVVLLGVVVGVMLFGVAVDMTLLGAAVRLMLPSVYVIGSLTMSNSCSIKNKVDGDSLFLLSKNAFSWERQMLVSKGIHSPKHVKPTVKLNLSLSNFLGGII
jgi:hypothetical protein